MSYETIVAPNAFDDLIASFRSSGGLPLELFSAVSSALERLARDPVGLGQKPLIPYPENGQIFHFDCEVQGTRHFLAAIFCYGDDENTLHILKVRHRRMIL